MKVEKTNIIALFIFIVIVSMMVFIVSLVPSNNKITGFIISPKGNELRLDIAKKYVNIGDEIEITILIKAKNLDPDALVRLYTNSKIIKEVRIKEYLERNNIPYNMIDGKIVKDIIVISTKIRIDQKINKVKALLMPDNIEAEEDLFI